MRSFWGLIPRYILKNKKRIFFMAVGIVLSITLISSLSIMVEALQKSSKDRIVNQAGGTYDIRFETRNYVRAQGLKTDSLVEKVSMVTVFGKYQVPNTNYELELGGYESNITELLNFKLIEGKFPSGGNEIALESWILDALPQKYKVGDKIRLSYTIEYVDSKGKYMPVNMESEFLLVGTFQHVANGFLNKNTAKAYLTKEFVEATAANKNFHYNGYLTVIPKYSIGEGLSQLSSTNVYSDLDFLPSSIKSFMLIAVDVMNLVTKIIFVIIGIVASVIIYNIFNVCISERTKDFGMLRAIGASPRKIKALVLGEGLLLGAIFIPLGILIGNLAIKAIIMVSSGYKDFNGVFSIPKEGVTASVIVGFLSILGGTYSSARKASQISPMEAITSNNNLKLKGRKIKKGIQSTKGIRKKASFTTNMAFLNVSRNKKRFTTTVVSLSITIIMFFTVNYLITNSDPINSFKKNFQGDFTLSTFLTEPGYGLTQDNIDKLNSIDGVKSVSKQKFFRTNVEFPKEGITQEGMDHIKEFSRRSYRLREDFEKGKYQFLTNVEGYVDQDLMRLKEGLLEGAIDLDKMKEEPIAIIIENLNYNNYTSLQVGSKLKIPYIRYDNKGNAGEKTQEVTIGAIVRADMLKNVDPTISSTIILNEKAMEKYLSIEEFQRANILLDKDADYLKVESEIKEITKLARAMEVKSFKEELKTIKKENLERSLIMYSFVSIVAVVSIINLINIMYMNVILRKREVAMMRALGLGSDEVRSMIKTEGMLYGISASMVGSILGILLTYGIFKVGRKVLMAGMTWEFPVMEVIAIFTVTIFITFIASVLPSRKLFTSSIVDSIRGIE